MTSFVSVWFYLKWLFFIGFGHVDHVLFDFWGQRSRTGINNSHFWQTYASIFWYFMFFKIILWSVKRYQNVYLIIKNYVILIYLEKLRKNRKVAFCTWMSCYKEQYVYTISFILLLDDNNTFTRMFNYHFLSNVVS